MFLVMATYAPLMMIMISGGDDDDDDAHSMFDDFKYGSSLASLCLCDVEVIPCFIEQKRLFTISWLNWTNIPLQRLPGRVTPLLFPPYTVLCGNASSGTDLLP